MNITANKGFIKDWTGDYILPITRAELVLDKNGNVALTSPLFAAGYTHEDGTINSYGLISAAERALISGGADGQGIGDVYQKLSQINTGLQVNGTPLTFYNETSKIQTPINITSPGGLSLTYVNNGTAGYNIQIGLQELTTADTSVAQILRSITVDKYGRVTAVTGSNLVNADIPNLEGKTLTNVTINGGKTETADIGTEATAIANKKYVDDSVAKATGVAVGALKFGGYISTTTDAINKLSVSDNINSYYKITVGFPIDSQYFHEGLSGGVKTGDTVIIHKNDSGTVKYIHIPSGDDVTLIGVKEQGEVGYILDPVDGEVVLNFSSLFDVALAGTGSKTVNITLDKASSSQDGYLSKEDYSLFKSYASDLAITYEQTSASAGLGVYSIGTLTIGQAAHTIYGMNDTYSLSLNNNTTTNEYNPVLKFTANGSVDTSFTYKGSKGIVIKKNGNDIEFTASNVIYDDSTDYLKTDGYQFGVKLGSFNENGSITEGLVNFSTIHNLALQVGRTTIFELIENSLIGTNESQYKYGNEKLKAAINVTI